LISKISSRLSLEYDLTFSVTVKPLEQFVRYSSILPYYQNVIKEGILATPSKTLINKRKESRDERKGDCLEQSDSSSQNRHCETAILYVIVSIRSMRDNVAIQFV
jgi:hypothetical protein